VQTNPQFIDVLQAFAAGYVESLLTYDVMYKHWYNTMHDVCDTRQELCHKVQDHLDRNLIWINDMIARHNNTDPYWHQVRLLLVITNKYGYLFPFNECACLKIFSFIFLTCPKTGSCANEISETPIRTHKIRPPEKP
jgi:hypothetical protein